jgi:hypothetical protein
MDFYKGSIPILDPDSAECRDMLYGHDGTFSLKPRDLLTDPPEMLGEPPAGVKTYDPSEWDALYDEQEKNESSLEHIFLRGGKPAFTNLDQGRDGDCWAYSTGHAWMLSRLRDNLDGAGPVVRANPHFIAAYLKRYNGGWCGASAKVLDEVGILPEGDGPGEWRKWSHAAPSQTHLAAAAKFRSDEQWFDLTRPVHGQVMTTRQLATCGFNNIPCPSDFNWQSHSVCQVRWVRIERDSWGPLILNSWLNWGRHGLAVYRGRQGIADNAVAVRTVRPSAK